MGGSRILRLKEAAGGWAPDLGDHLDGVIADPVPLMSRWVQGRMPWDSHHDEMKPITEYRKRKHRITQDEDRQTKEIERVFSQSLQTDMKKHTTTKMRKSKS